MCVVNGVVSTLYNNDVLQGATQMRDEIREWLPASYCIERKYSGLMEWNSEQLQSAVQVRNYHFSSFAVASDLP